MGILVENLWFLFLKFGCLFLALMTLLISVENSEPYKKYLDFVAYFEKFTLNDSWISLLLWKTFLDVVYY